MVEEPLLDVLNEDGTHSAQRLSKKEIHALEKLHRAVHLYLFNERNHLLMQKRSVHVDCYPGMYSISLTGHVDAGESSSQALYREIEEELGLDPKTLTVDFLFSYRQDVQPHEGYIDRQFNDVYVCFHPFREPKINFFDQEVAEVAWVPFEEFEKGIREKTNPLFAIYEKEVRELNYFMSKALRKVTYQG